MSPKSLGSVEDKIQYKVLFTGTSKNRHELVISSELTISFLKISRKDFTFIINMQSSHRVEYNCFIDTMIFTSLYLDVNAYL